MTNEDFFDMLNLNDDNEESQEDLLALFDDDEGFEDIEYTDTVLKQDKWDKARGKELCEKHNLTSPEATADFHSMAFQLEPTILGKCHDTRLQQFVETLMESPEYKELHHSTCQNPLASEIATLRFAKQYAQLVQNDDSDADSNEDCGESGDGEIDPNMLGAVSAALGEASQEVEQVEEMQEALGMAPGSGQGSDNHMSLDKVKETFRKVRNSRRLQRIFDRAGAWRRAGKAVQQNKVKHGYDDMIGIELAGDISRMVPNELALLDDEDFELDTLRRIVEQQTMCRQYEGVENENKGPVVVVVDESSSMSHYGRIIEAKALALAMCWIAQQQKRWIALVSFSGGRDGNLCLLKPGKWNQSQLIAWLSHFYEGGTSPYVPFTRVPGEYWEEMKPPKGKTDMILITDGEIDIQPSIAENFNKWKESNKVKLTSITVGGAMGYALEEVSNEVHRVGMLDTGSDAAKSVLSI